MYDDTVQVFPVFSALFKPFHFRGCGSDGMEDDLSVEYPFRKRDHFFCVSVFDDCVSAAQLTFRRRI